MPDPIKVYDARWDAGEFSDDEIRRLFEATLIYGRRLGVDTVTLARDARVAAGHVLELAVETTVRMGFRAFACPDPISTPHSYFMTLHVSQERRNTMGLTITASHNPASCIGVKFTVPVVQAIGRDCGPDGGLTAVRKIYHGGEKAAAPARGSLELLNLTREYVEFSMQQAGVGPGGLAGMTVVLDGMNGSAGPEVYSALQQAGATVEPLRLVPDGSFPTGSPNPTSRGKMDLAITRARETDPAIVIGLDGDGDRIVFGDRRGLLAAGFVAVPLIRAMRLDARPGPRAPVLCDPKVNPVALAEWGRLRARPLLFRNGHSQIKARMQQVDAVAAAEESGHYYHRISRGDLTVCCENSALTILSFLGAIRSEPTLLDELWKMQAAVRTTGEFNYQLDGDEPRDRAMADVIALFTREGASTATATPDGIDLEGTVLSHGVTFDETGVRLTPDWYGGYLRIATNEKSVLRSYFSAGDAEVLRRVETATRHMIEKTHRGRVID